MSRFGILLMVSVVFFGSGCVTPTQVAMKVGMFAVGKVIDDKGTADIAKKIVGQSPEVADAELGPRNDTYRQVGGSTMWISYPVKLDVLKRDQYFVEVSDNRVVRIEKMEGTSSELQMVKSTLDKTRVHGKSPEECQRILESGPPELSVRSQNSGKLLQFYNGEKIIDIGDKRYVILHFDRDERCEKLQVVDVAASST